MIDFLHEKIAAMFETRRSYIADKVYEIDYPFQSHPFPYFVWQRDYVWQCFAVLDPFRCAPIRTEVARSGHVDIWMKVR